jgi:5-formyltetrahydrofolate cyclo-ligase
MNKRETRRELFARIRALRPAERADRSAAIRSWLERDASFQKAEVVFSYLALPGEPDLAPLVAAFPGKCWAFSRVTSEDRITFHTMRATAEAVPGSHGILEPDPGKHPEASPLDADLFLVPGVGFDPETGTRLGRGKGHYDRYLSVARNKPLPAELVGVAFSVQWLELTPEEHDIPMDRVVSETGWG